MAPAGLFVDWSTQPDIPGDAGNNITVTDVMFRLDNLRVIGDAGPGDPRTTATDFSIHWAQDQKPDRIAFMDAPIGLYSKVSMSIDGHLIDNSIDITGKVTVSGDTKPFEIQDRGQVGVSMMMNKMLDAGGSATIGVQVDFSSALAAIDWTQVPTDEGMYDLNSINPLGYPQMMVFEQSLVTAFHVEDSGTGSGQN